MLKYKRDKEHLQILNKEKAFPISPLMGASFFLALSFHVLAFFLFDIKPYFVNLLFDNPSSCFVEIQTGQTLIDIRQEDPKDLILEPDYQKMFSFEWNPHPYQIFNFEDANEDPYLAELELYPDFTLKKVMCPEVQLFGDASNLTLNKEIKTVLATAGKSLNFKIWVENKTGEIFWFEPLNFKNENKQAQEILLALHFNPVEQEGITQGIAEVVIND